MSLRKGENEKWINKELLKNFNVGKIKKAIFDYFITDGGGITCRGTLTTYDNNCYSTVNESTNYLISNRQPRRWHERSDNAENERRELLVRIAGKITVNSMQIVKFSCCGNSFKLFHKTLPTVESRCFKCMANTIRRMKTSKSQHH